MYFIKQYGEKRTGSNLVRALIKQYFLDVEVLMHVLGDKHQIPGDFSCLRDTSLSTEQFTENIVLLTNSKPAETTHVENKEQLNYLQSIAPALQMAIKNDWLIYIITVKNPYAWVVSLLKFNNWNIKEALFNNEQKLLTYLTDACYDYNKKYRSWMALTDQYPHRASIIRHEDLLTDMNSVMNKIGSLYNLKTNNVREKTIEGIVFPTHWDNNITRAHSEKFNKSFYLNHDYLQLLSSSMLNVINNTIDWALLARLNYNKEDYLKKG